MNDADGFKEWKHKQQSHGEKFTLPNVSKSKPNIKKLNARRLIEDRELEKQLSNEFDYLEKS
ncbi:hypothetical protein CGK40_17860 [Vibrio parahaemolyticus]|uniref:hypothetical protein n=1 Tax=Vibrio parahaemolyticus TaxID=670 RepID=UPI0011241581|nr:hypothetical protein [Vibrio parahaemolyticus]TNZ92716.1 hypothetical protein CGK40_17860 [Vibrio parahaemolyticus]